MKYFIFTFSIDFFLFELIILPDKLILFLLLVLLLPQIANNKILYIADLPVPFRAFIKKRTYG